MNFAGQNNQIAFFCGTVWGFRGITYTVHLWLVGKRAVDFLLMLTEPFSAALTVESLCTDIGRNCGVRKEWVTLSANFGGTKVVH